MTTQQCEPWGQPMDTELILYLGDWQVQSLRYMQSKEGAYTTNTCCLSHEEYVQCIDFIHGSCHRLKAQLETLCLACNILNRVLSKVYRRDIIDKVALVCGACITLAYKYEEATFWEDATKVLIDTSPKGTTKADFFNAELYVWSLVDFDLGYPSPLHFIRWTSMYAENANADVRSIAKFLLECETLSEGFRDTSSSILACTCILGARMILQMTPLWSHDHIAVTGFTIETLLPFTMKLKQVLETNGIENLNVVTKHSPLSSQIIARRQLLGRM